MSMRPHPSHCVSSDHLPGPISATASAMVASSVEISVHRDVAESGSRRRTSKPK